MTAGVRRGRRISRPLVLRLGVAVIVLLGWEVYVRSFGTFATPPLGDVAAGLWKVLLLPDFWHAAFTSLSALLVGFLLAAVLAVPVGIFAGRIVVLRQMVGVYLTLMISVPVSALVPIVVVLFGISLNARLAVIFLFAFPAIAVNVLTGVASVDRSLLEMGRSYGCTGARQLRRIVLPAIMPEIFVGMRLGAGRAIIGMVVAELIVMSVGFGELIDRYGSRFEMGSLFAIVIVILAISVLLLQLLAVLEKKTLRWRVSTTSQNG